ncbi:unnamed protein product [Didymodactylos carnosus]|uniref:Uncharacterized protein n=1 Tax=Didymodactylos carnosus TaxID=1234261 RepID=A0A814KZY6_9BILA|nr:unnamed protein product [Didymodactylos carnosus]CAF1058107.1 unnamed protein product [Didymodactylos carnosus]CAF3614928.1 unnamed protein product [Didymodactylos carnosus]CAF3826804.1 unnamed protein product [Didymodactylos carnosus]
MYKTTALVPNIIHYIRWDKPTFNFVDIVCMRSAYLAQKPDKIYIHTNTPNFRGKYWIQLKRKWPDLYQRIKIILNIPPTSIWGQNFSSGWHLYHASDIERIKILMKYGGIFADNDLYVVRNLDKFRHFEMTLGWIENDPGLGTMIYIAHKHARFLPLYIDTYREYNETEWYWNAGIKPVSDILLQRPELIHRVKNLFGVGTDITYNLYTQYWPRWKKYYTIHLCIRHRDYMYKKEYKEFPVFNENTILHYNYTFGEMARLAYFSK